MLFSAVATKDEIHVHALMGKSLKELRNEAGYTSQETFTYDAEIPRAHYRKYEKGFKNY